ncbi:MAG: hypothetical protein GQ564_04990 [Bacteroidales bacterium]|nr:hypothetical protein [Bacteroidales bacterium]
MKHTLKITLFIVFQLLNFTLQAQSDFNKFEIIKGEVLDDSTGFYIPFANIFNESKKTWDSTNEKGSFSIWADIGDTLMLSAVGYLSYVTFITDSLIKENLVIKLEPRAYEIGEVTIKSIKPYSKFKQDVLNLDLPQTELDSITNELTLQSKEAALKADYEREVKEVFAREDGTLFVLGLSKLSSRKEHKQQKALKKAVNESEEKKIIDKKYNREIVKIFTKLTDKELTDFMIFCNFSNEFLLETNDYDIAKAILEKCIEYKKIH